MLYPQTKQRVCVRKGVIRGHSCNSAYHIIFISSFYFFKHQITCSLSSASCYGSRRVRNKCLLFTVTDLDIIKTESTQVNKQVHSCKNDKFLMIPGCFDLFICSSGTETLRAIALPYQTFVLRQR